ncbi:MAG: glycosyl hydrolase [Calditrichaeota bacterium]|nr:glycosyl hydrolase [Calditrichota bacterium]
MKKFLISFLTFLLLFSPLAAKKSSQNLISSKIVSGLKFRSIGPAFTSGRIADFAVNPKNHSEWYVAVASGNIWKTENNGTTFKSVFDKYGAYSIGCLTIDPNNPNVIWAGTGENNSQRALGYGDGVYKTEDGGKSWKNMGLKTSRQIGKILIDPRNSDVVYVAAEGSVWGPGGERGLYKSENGGKTWKAILTISENTGVSDLAMDPRNPDVIYAASHQRRRHVFTKIDGGPESRIYKTTDGGKTWVKLKSGLPGGHVGAIGLAVSPVNPDYVYAIIEAEGSSGGFFRSTDRGASWQKMSGHVANSPQYYNEIFCDPVDANKVYSMETIAQYTLDGGKTWTAIGNRFRHVDDHALWIAPEDTRHLLIGGDGGIYETFDAGKNWVFKSNLPVTQFYRVAVDNEKPFYYVYGGTQDNNSMGGPSRTTSSFGIVNDDWFVTNGGDGFWSACDPEDPNIVYAESQYGGMVRYDKRSGESISIRPQPRKGEYTYRWNWNTPLFVSPHSSTRIYCAANKVFRSEDRGNTWQVISDDLTRQIDRNKLPLMGRYWSVDAVAKNASTSLYGTIVSLAESPLQEDLLYAGTDDGLIQVTEDAGKTWRKIEKFPGVPETTYVSDILPSNFDANVVYASFDNRKRDDFKPYILKSTDKGKTWKSVASNLPKNGTVHTIQQDFVDANLLFVGTEFGFFFSIDGGKNWTQLKSGLPTIAVRDIAVQKRENDLVLATFGRGFYILDDYSPLRLLSKKIIDKEADIFPIKDALMFVPTRGKTNQGSTYFAAPNPPVGAVFTYYLQKAPKTLKQKRKEKERKLFKEKKFIPYPSWDQLRAEDNEEKPYLLFTIFDSEGNIVRKIPTSAKSGIHRIVWDFRYQDPSPISLRSNKYNPLSTGRSGLLAAPGDYKVSMSLSVNGKLKELVPPQEFKTVALDNTTLPAKDRMELVTFQSKAAELYRIVQGTINATQELAERIEYIKQAIHNSPVPDSEHMADARALEASVDSLLIKFVGDRTISRRNENPPTSLSSRLRTMAYTHRRSTSDITTTEKDAYKIIKDEFVPLYQKVKEIHDVRLPELEKKLEAIKAPWTPGRLPVWEEK